MLLLFLLFFVCCWLGLTLQLHIESMNESKLHVAISVLKVCYEHECPKASETQRGKCFEICTVDDDAMIMLRAR